MIIVKFLIENCPWTRKLLMEVDLVGLSVVHSLHEGRIVEGEMT